MIPVHLVNAACDMEPILAVAAKHGIRVLEDAAQAMGVTYRGKQVGTLGDAGAFSLQLEKNITSGEGGVVATQSFEVHDRAARYQDQGGQFTTSKGEIREHTSGQPFLGVNLRMTELAGAIAGVQLQRLDEMVARSRAAAQEIRIGDLPVEWRRLPDESGEGGSVVMFLQSGEVACRFGRALRAEGVAAGQLYGGRRLYQPRDPRTSHSLGHGLSLPLYAAPDRPPLLRWPLSRQRRSPGTLVGRSSGAHLQRSRC